jgi:branched-chain amino acid transport system permease protein
MGVDLYRACLLRNPHDFIAGKTGRSSWEEIKKMDVIQLFTKNRKLLWRGFLALILILVITLPLYGGRYHVSVLTFVLVYVVLAVSWAMFSGTTGYMSLAPAAFFGLGVYSMAILQNELPFPIIMVIGGLVSFAFALLIGLVTLRLKGIYFAIFTFGLVVFMSELIQQLETRLKHGHGWDITPMNHAMLLYVALGLAVVTVLAIYFIRRSRYGLAILSIGGNEEAAAHMGVNTTMVKVFSFAISATFMGIAGVIAAPKLIYVNTSVAFSTVYSFMPILMAVFGGMGTLYGPVAGAVVFAYLDIVIRNEFPRYFLLIFGVTLVVVILFLPNGIAGLMPMLRERLGRLRAKLWKGGQAKQHADT